MQTWVLLYSKRSKMKLPFFLTGQVGSGGSASFCNLGAFAEVAQTA